MAGVLPDDELDLDEAMGLASFLVMSGRAPAPVAWVDGFIESAIDEANEGFAESFF